MLARSLSDPHFSVGCHVVLLDGEPLLPTSQVASLLQPNPGNGRFQFRDNLNDFAIASFRHKLVPDEIEAEAAAQIERIQAAGVQPSHFDTHKHAHMFPAVLRPLLRAAGLASSGRTQPFRAGLAAAHEQHLADAQAMEAVRSTERITQLRRQVPAGGRVASDFAPRTDRWACW